MTNLTPPPGPPAAPPVPPVPPVPPAPGTVETAPRPATSGASRVVAILAIVLGALVILGGAATAIAATVASGAVHTSTRTVDVTGVSELDLDVSAGSVSIEFTDVSQAELEVTSAAGADRWRLERDGDELIVESPRRFGPWFFDGWLFGRSEAVLRLPASLQDMDADLSLSAGDLTVGGEFRELDLDVSAGQATVTASARSVSVDVSAGGGRLELTDVATAEFMMSAGSLDVRMDGRQPDDVDVDVSAGSLDLTVPEGSYDVTSEVSAGQFDNRIGSTPGASSVIRVELSAGGVTLRSR